MGLKFVLLVLLDLTALLFNSEMLWCCYRNKMMSKFLKKSRALCIIQGICQLTILATASVQAVMDCYIDDQRSNSCQILELVFTLYNVPACVQFNGDFNHVFWPNSSV